MLELAARILAPSWQMARMRPVGNAGWSADDDSRWATIIYSVTIADATPAPETALVHLTGTERKVGRFRPTPFSNFSIRYLSQILNMCEIIPSLHTMVKLKYHNRIMYWHIKMVTGIQNWSTEYWLYLSTSHHLSSTLSSDNAITSGVCILILLSGAWISLISLSLIGRTDLINVSHNW